MLSVKLHISGANKPQTDLKVYDYLWVGEGGRNGDKLRETVKNHPPYVAPCLDMSRAKIESEDELYLHAIPYMQFPVLLAGRPFTGERHEAVQRPPLGAPPVSEPAQEGGLSRADRAEYSDKEQMTPDEKLYGRLRCLHCG